MYKRQVFTEISAELSVGEHALRCSRAFHAAAMLWEGAGKWKVLGLSSYCQCLGRLIVSGRDILFPCES